ncbi:MAG: sterol desaturase family protein [Hyphomicrobiaceae bacterium]
MPVPLAQIETVSIIAALVAVAAAERFRPRIVRRISSPWRCRTNVLLFALNATLIALPLSWLVGQIDNLRLSTYSENTAPGWAVVAFWLGWIFLLDLASYFLHRLLHWVPLFFRMHCAHHSDDDVDLTTAFRRHPMEFLFDAALMLLAGFAIGAPLEVNGAYGILATVFQIWHHGNIALTGPLGRILAAVLVTPALHRTHHALDVRVADGNFGTVLSVWDRMFGTLRADPEPPRFGVPGLDEPRHQRIGNVLLSPVLLDPHAGER